MRRPILLAALAATLAASAAPVLAQSQADQRRFQVAQRRFDRETAIYEAERQRFDATRDDWRGGRPYGDGRGFDEAQFATDYDASRDYRDGPNYRERVLDDEDQVYRGSDGQYYCRRGDGTTGLIVGGAAGGVLGNVIDGGRRRTAGTLIGGALGALLGRSVQQQQQQQQQDVRCR